LEQTGALTTGLPCEEPLPINTEAQKKEKVNRDSGSWRNTRTKMEGVGPLGTSTICNIEMFDLQQRSNRTLLSKTRNGMPLNG